MGTLDPLCDIIPHVRTKRQTVLTTLLYSENPLDYPVL